jgi:hypothetical protein
LRHHPNFDGAGMAQPGLRRHQSVPKEKDDGILVCHHFFQDGAPMAQMAQIGKPSNYKRAPMDNRR